MTNKSEVYNARYTDSTGQLAVNIENDFQLLSLEIEGVKFEGNSFNSLSIIDKHIYSEAQLQRFTLQPIQVWNTTDIEEELTNFTLDFVISQLIINVASGYVSSIDLLLNYSLTATDERFVISLTLDGVTYTGSSDFIEIAFDRIRNLFADKYRFKNCYGCMYGDYSVYGSNSFGTMLCFANQKQEYQATNSKDAYMELAPPRDQVQEIYCCPDYEVRRKGIGYRG